MEMKFWGTRGSVGAGMTNAEYREKLVRILMKASPENVGTKEAVEAFIENLPFIDRKTLGGNTSCVEVRFGESLMVFDAGSGLRLLGQELMKQHGPQIPYTINIFLSHFHWDHIQGFPFFGPAFIPGNTIKFYSAMPDAYDLLKRQQEASYFPVKFEDFGADIEFITVDGEKGDEVEGISVHSQTLMHPGSSTGFKLSDGKATIVYMSDTEIVTLKPDEVQEYQSFISDADCAIVDSQYDFEESHQKKFWGHSSPFRFIDVLKGTGVKRAFLFHHDPGNTDQDIYELHKRAREYKELNCPDDSFDVLIAIEGDEYTF